jgi:hypothetical protein
VSDLDSSWAEVERKYVVVSRSLGRIVNDVLVLMS